MRILALSDLESDVLWNHYDKNPIRDTDLILSCGDLKPEYLTFIETLSNVPLLYVHGNHDDRYDTTPPEGCFCIDDKIYVHDGVRILGLGGCLPYDKKKYMYTEEQMKRRIKRLRRQLKKYGGFDILLSHNAAAGLGDGSDYAHTGYEVFRELLDKYRPKYMVHGHVHFAYEKGAKREREYNGTKIINAYIKHSWEY